MAPAEAISLLSARVLVNILPQSNLTETLVSDFMNYCFFVDEDRETLIVKTISEPILSHAAGIILNGDDKMAFWSRTLTLIGKVFRDGMAHAGYLGEFTARVLFTLAWDLGAKSHTITKRQTVGGFFCNLLHTTVFEEFENQCAEHHRLIEEYSNEQGSSYTLPKLLDYVIFFTHFVQVYKYTPTKKRLLEMFERGAAVITQAQQYAIDVIIPIYCPSSDGSLKEENMSYILISIKNRKDNGDHIAWMNAIRPHEIGVLGKDQRITLPFVSLVINLGCEHSEYYISSPVKPQRKQPERTVKTGNSVEGSKDGQLSLSLELANHRLTLVGLPPPPPPKDKSAAISGAEKAEIPSQGSPGPSSESAPIKISESNRDEPGSSDASSQSFLVYNTKLYDLQLYKVLKTILKLNNSLADLVAYNNSGVSVKDLETFFSSLDPLSYPPSLP